MKQILKYMLHIRDEQVISMPLNAILMSVGMKNGILCLWVMADPDACKVERCIYIVGTGNPVDDKLQQFVNYDRFVGTAIDQDSGLVWHVFGRTCKEMRYS